MKVKLEALKRQSYNTRRLEAGDVFEADRKFARVLIAQKRAREFSGEVARPAPEPEPAPADNDRASEAGSEESPAEPASEINELRTEYERVVGKRPFNGWDAATLRERMAAHPAGGEESKEPAGNA